LAEEKVKQEREREKEEGKGLNEQYCNRKGV